MPVEPGLAASPSGEVLSPEYELARMRAMADRHPALLWISDTSGLCTNFNASWLAFTGRTLEQERGTGWLEGVHPDDADACMATYLERFGERTPFEMEYRLRRADGEYRRILDAGAPWYLADEEFAGFVGSCLDITDYARGRQGLAEAEELHRATVDALHEGVIVTDAHGAILSVNNAAEVMLDASEAELVGRPLTVFAERLSLVSADGSELSVDQPPSVAVVGHGESVFGRVIGWSLDGGPIRWHLVTSRPIHSPGTERVFAAVTSFVDITEQKATADRATYSAGHDPLTGLANRAELRKRLTALKERKPRSGSELAVAFCDIDDFKGANDRLGHSAGDRLLQAVCDRVVASVRSGDFVARLGGDEMVVLLEAVDGLDGAITAAEKIRMAVAVPVEFGVTSVTPTISVGVALVAPDEDLDVAIDRADEAMYIAKGAGRNRVETLERR